jgi:hypothetical protein
MRVLLATTLSAFVLLASWGCSGGQGIDSDEDNPTPTPTPTATVTRSPFTGKWSGTWYVNTGIVTVLSGVADDPATEEVNEAVITVIPAGTTSLEVAEDGTLTGTLTDTSTFTNGVLMSGKTTTVSGRVATNGAITATLTTPDITATDSLTGTLQFLVSDKSQLRAPIAQRRSDGTSSSGLLTLAQN